MAGRNEGRCAFKLERGDSTEDGRLSPSRKDGHAKGAPEWDSQGVKCWAQTPFLNPDPFNWWYGVENVARERVNGESCMALLDNGTQINTIMPGYVENHSLDVRPISGLPHRQKRHLHRSGKCPHMTNWLHHHMGSSRQSPGLWWGSDSPCNPRYVQLHGLGPHDSRNPHDRPHHECDKGKWDGHAVDTLGQCPHSLPFGSMMSHCHGGRWQSCY